MSAKDRTGLMGIKDRYYGWACPAMQRLQVSEVQNGYLGSEREEGGLSQVNGPESRQADGNVRAQSGREVLIGLRRASAGDGGGARENWSHGRP